MTRFFSKLTACVAFTLTLCACGGSGGDAATNITGDTEVGATVETAKPSSVKTVVQDNVPTGAPLTLSSNEYFPSNHGDTWTYDQTQGAQTTENAVTRSVTAIDGANYAIEENSVGSKSSRTNYKRTTNGSSISAATLLGSRAPALAQSIVGSIIEYSEPFYPVGGERKLIRQGDWGEDLDKDGINDGFHLEYVQVLNGIESINTKLGTFSTVHFTTTFIFTLMPSDPRYVAATFTATEHTWWAPGIGLVQATREVTRSDGVAAVPQYTLKISSARVNGQDIVAKDGLDGTVRKIDLPHNALIYDKFRNRYLATVPGSVPTHGNSIAMIDPDTGAVSYTPWIGSDPTAMAISYDGNYLFVALRGTGEVLKYRIADMQVMWRARLPNDSFYGQLLTETLSASPIDTDTVAVATMATGVTPKHRGVVLIQAGSIQSRQTQVHTGSNLIAFDGSGQYVYGYNNESTEFGLRRIEVLADGLTEQQVISTSGNFGPNNLIWTTSGIWLAASKYRASDLSPLGYVSGAAACVPLNSSIKVVCSSSDWDQRSRRLVTADATTFVVAANPVFANNTFLGGVSLIVPGPIGQVAMHFDPVYSPSFYYPSVVLFSSQELK